MQLVSGPGPCPADHIPQVDSPCGCGGGAVIPEQLDDRSAQRLARIDHHVLCPLWLAAVAYLSADLDSDD